MFGPNIPVRERQRIYDRRFRVALLVSTGLTLIALFVIPIDVSREPPQTVGLFGPLQVADIIEAPTDDVAPHELLAGGHPLPEAFEAVDYDLEETLRAPDLPDRTREGESEREIPDIETPREGPATGEGPSSRTAARLTLQSERFAILKFVKPPYPPDAKLMGIEGRIMVQAFVGPDGLVKDVRTGDHDVSLRSCAEAAEWATRQWEFLPVTENGRPVSFWLEIPFRFALGGVSFGT